MRSQGRPEGRDAAAERPLGGAGCRRGQAAEALRGTQTRAVAALAAAFAVALSEALLLSVVLGDTAEAHHNWAGYDTSRTFYLAGTVREVDWGSPHAEVLLEVPAGVVAPGGLARADVSDGLEKVGGRRSLERAAAPEDAAGEWEVEFESPSFMAGRGMGGPPRVGETMGAVGFLSRSGPGKLRVESVFLGDGRTISVRYNAVPTLPSGEQAEDRDPERVAPEGEADGAWSATGRSGAGVEPDSAARGATGTDPKNAGWWVAYGGVAALALVSVSPHAVALLSPKGRGRPRGASDNG